MSIRVEFYGIPRSRAGVEFTLVDFEQDGIPLGELLGNLSRRFPDLVIVSKRIGSSRRIAPAWMETAS